MIVEPAAGDRVEDNLNPVGRAYYGFSTLLCTPASLSQDVGLALGAQAGPARIEQVVREAGFTPLPPRRRDPVQPRLRSAPLMLRTVAPLALAWLGVAAPAAAAGQTVGQLFPPTHDCGKPAGVTVTALQTGVASGNSYTVAAPGVITSWSFQNSAVTVVGLKLKVGRPAGGVNYLITAESAAGPQTPNAVNTYPARIPVAADDRIGIAVGGGGCAAQTMDAADTWVGIAFDVLPNTTAPFDESPAALKFPIAAYVEPDADADGFGDESQDQCPADPSTHGPCPTPSPPRDATAPVLSSSATSVRPSRTGSISFLVSSDEDATGSATATVNRPGTARPIRFAPRRLTLSAGVPTRITLTLSRRKSATLRRALSTRRPLKAKVALAVKDAAGNASSRKLTLRLRRAPQEQR